MPFYIVRRRAPAGRTEASVIIIGDRIYVRRISEPINLHLSCAACRYDMLWSDLEHPPSVFENRAI